MSVANSPLVKTAAFGGDPNPGRILQAVGAAGVDLDPVAVDVTIGVALSTGAGRSRAVGCDLSYEYVRINGEYTT